MPADSNLQMEPGRWIQENTSSVRVRVVLDGGLLLYAFKQFDGSASYEWDPLPEHEFVRMNNWALRHGEELEITVRRFPPPEGEMEQIS